MAYAGEIITSTFNRTKELFFLPLRPKYWLKMGFVSLMAGNSQGGSYNGGSGSSGKGFPADMTLKQFIADINTKALAFLSQYGYLIGVGVVMLYFIGLLFSYLASVFTFVFIDGLMKKEISIGTSFSEYKKQGGSLFKLRFIVGLISLAVTIAIFYPLILAFFRNTLAEFNFWLLIPMIIGMIILSIPLSIFFFLVDDFVVPIMYTKKSSFGEAWKEFKKISARKKGEIFIYWLLKICLGIVAGLGSFIVMLPVMLLVLALIALGALIYLGLQALVGMTSAVIAIVILAIFALFALTYFITVLLVPISAFFRIYSLEMVNKMQESRKNLS